MKTISTKQLGELLLSLRSGATFLGVSALIDARPRKTGNPFAAIMKLSTFQAVTAINYEASVNRQLDREGKDQLTFTAKEHSWGHRVPGSPALLEHNTTGELYLVAQVLKARKPIYLVRDRATSPLRIVDKSTVDPYLPPVRHAENQGTEKEIVYRNYALSGIVSLRGFGESYRVRRAIAA